MNPENTSPDDDAEKLMKSTYSGFHLPLPHKPLKPHVGGAAKGKARGGRMKKRRG